MHELPKSHFNEEADEDLIYLGQRLAWEGERLFGLRGKDRRQHTYAIGKTGTGKSSLLRNALIQDLHAGRGVGLIDPHGDLASDLLEHIPPSRTDDLLYFNPADRDYPVSFNLFATSDIDGRHLVTSGIVTAFKSI
jgi:DNA helicase HerA-like ATPase